MQIIWDPDKRQINLEKHGLDFVDAMMVLDSPFRLDIGTLRNREPRTQSFAYVFDLLAVLTLVFVERESAIRIISFRPAREVERTGYYEWLENDVDVG